MIEQMEAAVLYFFQSIHTPVLDKIMVAVTTLGEFGAIWVVIGVLLLAHKKYRKYGLMLLTALLFGLLFGNGLLKNLVERSRPCWRFLDIRMLIAIPKDYSFPSGHTMSSFEAITVLFYMNRKIGVAALVLGTMIACSRMYLFVHYPTDIFVGLLLGVLFGVLSIYLWNRQYMMGEKHDETV